MVDFASSPGASRRPARPSARPSTRLSGPGRWAVAGLAVVLVASLLGTVAEPPAPAPAAAPAVAEWRGNSGSLAPAPAR
jgi:hypothetical protein